MERLRKVHIVGGAGSGKTTLACLLSEELGVPAYDLDTVGYEEGAGPKRPLQAKLADVQRIANQRGWVTEGVFLGWTEELFQRSDAIIWLDLPFSLAAWRIFLRHLKGELAGTNQHPGWRTLGRFLWDVRRYHTSESLEPRALDDDAAVTRDATERALQPWSSKVLVCHRSADVRQLMASFLQRE
jgi:adenylate kinase family enzyme